MKKQSVRFTVLTAAFLALLIVFQGMSASFGQMVTGSFVNLVLVAATLLVGWKSGFVIAILSPFFAKLFGIGPIYPILPVVALGNATLVAVYAFIMSRTFKTAFRWVVSVVAAAAFKYAVLTIGVVKLVLPLVSVPAPQAAKLAAMFGTTQFFTAFCGGVIAFIVVPLIKMAVKR